MNRFEQANEIFGEAVSLPPGERTDFVRQRCGADLELAETVLNLLSNFDKVGSFLHEPVTALPLMPRSSSQIQPGAFLCNRFAVLDRLGGGGMGEVFRADDQELDEIVALKTIRADYKDHERLMTRFREEIKLSRKSGHPNICGTYDLFTHVPEDGSPPIRFFTMAFLEGETLASLLRSKGPLAIPDALRIGAGIAAGLDSLHAKGIVHRDLKPANVILVGKGSSARPVITDFGLARPLERPEDDPGQTTTGQIMGTVAYMSPEQFEGSHIDGRTDIFAFGIMLHEMVTGVRPYPTESMVRSAVRRLTNDPEISGVPPNWHRVLRKAMARKPSDRYEFAREIIEDLESDSFWAKMPVLSRRTWIGGAAVTIGAMSSFWWIPRLLDRTAKLPATPVMLLNPIQHAPADEKEATLLDALLNRQLGQSAWLRLLDKDRAKEVWARISGKEEEKMPAAIEASAAREIAMRAGAAFAAFGSYGQAGDQRILNLTLELLGSSPNSPRRQWSQAFYARRDSDIPAMSQDASTWLRRSVGESDQDMLAHSRPVEELTTPSWQAFQEFGLGLDAARDNHMNEATLHLEAALRIDPNFAAAAARLGDYLRMNGRLDEALEYWAKAAAVSRGRNLNDRESLRIQGMFDVDTLQFREAERVYARYCLEFPNDPLPFFYRASMLERLGRLEEAEARYTDAIKLGGGYSSVMSRSINHLMRGQIELAEKDFREGQQLDSARFTDQIRMGIAMSKADRKTLEEGLARLKASTDKGSKSQASTREACWMYETGNVERAIRSFQSGIAMDREAGISVDEQNSKVLLLARVLLAEHRSSEAIELCKEALSRTTGKIARLKFGAFFAEAGDVRLAESCASHNLPDWPMYKVYASRLSGEIAYARRDFQRALEHCKAAVLPPPERQWPGFLVRAALAAGDFETAGQTLRALFAAPGLYWLNPELSQPGFVKAGIAWVGQVNRWPDLNKRIQPFATMLTTS